VRFFLCLSLAVSYSQGGRERQRAGDFKKKKKKLHSIFGLSAMMRGETEEGFRVDSLCLVHEILLFNSDRRIVCQK